MLEDAQISEMMSAIKKRMTKGAMIVPKVRVNELTSLQ